MAIDTDSTAHSSGCGCGMCAALRDIAGNEYYQLGAPDSSLAPGVEEGDGAAGGAASGTANPVDLSLTFSLSSLPGASQTIYLDFDGHVTSGTVWNSSFAGGADIVTPAYDFDGNTSAFSDAELARIQYIWQRVAEDYAPFNVNVTTRDPGLEALRKTSTSDTQWGVRVVIGGNGAWYGSGYGGVAYRSSFTYNSDTPAFVFPANLAGGSEKSTAEAISHETGHTLGLAHDGSSTTSYYRGSGSGETGWAPILGTAYYQNLTQFSKGEYAGANNTQDDLAIITTQNGFGYRADDYGSTLSSAFALSPTGGTISGNGIIERNTDADVFRFSTGSGTISFNVVPADRGPNLDIQASLYDAAGNLILVSNPTGSLSASFSVTLAAGQYFLKVEGVGEGDPVNGGYSDYGSLGQYWFTGTVAASAPTAVAPTVSVSAVSAPEGSGTMTFRVSLAQPATEPVAIAYTTVNGTAVAGSDYTATSGTLTFAAGEFEKFVTVSLINDTAVESTETFTLQVSSADGQPLTVAQQGAGTITDDDVVPPSVTVTGTSRNEGNPVSGSASQTAFTFTIDLSVVSSTSVTVSYATADGTAVAGSDYTATSGSVTFAPGETTKTVTVYVVGDGTFEADEAFALRLTGTTMGTITQNTATATILNDDVAPTVSVSAVSAPEGSGTMTFRVSLAQPATEPVAIAYTTVNGTAVAGSDYTATSGTLTFAAGEFEKFVTVSLINDTAVESTETFTLQVSSADGQPLTVAQQGAGTITDDDVVPPSVTVTGTSRNEGNPVSGSASQTAFTFTIDLSVVSSTSVTVSYATADGTAVAGSDYTATSGSVTFAPGETTKTVTVYVVGDGTFEADEAFALRLTGTTMGTITQNTATATILNDDAAPTVVAPTVSVSAVSAPEGSGTMTFRVSLAQPATEPVAIAYTTVNGTAVAGSDFVGTSGTVTFAAGEFEKFVTVSLINDTVVESTETFTLQVSSADGQPLTVAQQGTGTITDDDVAPPPPSSSITASVNSVSKREGNAKGNKPTQTAFTFTITLSAASTTSVTVSYATADGTAVAGSDYTATSGSVTFAPGQTTKTVTVYVVGDSTFEDDETFTLRLTGATGATVAGGDGTGTILNDDKRGPQGAPLPGEVAAEPVVEGAAPVEVTPVGQAAQSDAAPVAANSVPVAAPAPIAASSVQANAAPAAVAALAPATDPATATFGPAAAPVATNDRSFDPAVALLGPAATGPGAPVSEFAANAASRKGSPWDYLLSLDL